MELNQRIDSLEKWGKWIKKKNLQSIFPKVTKANPWFTSNHIAFAIEGIDRYLDPLKLTAWIERYVFENSTAKTIGIIMAGNIPLVGIHDLICCYLCGHRAIVKPSRQDTILISYLLDNLYEIDPSTKKSMILAPDLNSYQLDAVIATGSDNTNRYFKHQFGDIPSIIRSNRTSVGVIRGDETAQQLQGLGLDILSYFGRGCRNISKILVPPEYDFKAFVNLIQSYGGLLNNPKYLHNYKYQKALRSIQDIEYIDTGFLLLLQSEALVSPLSVLYYDYYTDLDQLQNKLARHHDKIQCIASANGWYYGSIEFGGLQSPELWDYADGIDTVEFLLNL